MRQPFGCFTRPARVIAVVAALTLFVSGCTQRDSDPVSLPGFAPTTKSSAARNNEPSANQTDAPGSTQGGGENEGSGTAEGEMSGGPGGAPWDPCQIITWDDLPGERPGDPEAAEPEPQTGEQEDAYTAGCRFGAKTNDVIVLWGPSDKASIEPSGQHGEEQIHIASRPGLQIVTLSESLNMICLIKVDLGNRRGIAGVGAYARSTEPAAGDKHPCAIAVRLAAEVVKRTPSSY